MNARKTAVDCLIRCERGGYSNLVLMQELERSGLDARDRAFCTALFYGTVSRKLTADHLINRFVKRGTASLDVEVLCILRAGIYQLFWMDSVPSSAAVNESVKLCRAFRKSSASGLVNAVLRRCAEQDPDSIWKGIDDRIGMLSVRYSVGQELLSLLDSQYGDRLESVIVALQKESSVHVRVNSLRWDVRQAVESLKAEGIEAEETDIPNCLKVISGNPAASEAMRAGRIHIQSYPALFAAMCVGAGPDERVLDMCSAPGGKTVCMAQDMKNRGELTALDIHPSRVKLIKDIAERQGIGIIDAVCADAASFDADGVFDRVLCDVPCSGYGEMAAKPELRYKDPSVSADLPELQYRILCKGARATAPGGRLVYSTCTLLKRENEDIVERFLGENRDFIPAKPEFIPCSSVAQGNMISFIPNETDAEGFFVAVFTKI